MSDNEKPQFETARSTLALDSANSPSTDPMSADEERMRRALGLYGDRPRARPPERNEAAPQRPVERFPGTNHKRRFVHDGEVPVTVVHGLIPGRRDHGDGNGGRNGHAQPTNRLEVAEAALASEIATRERTERALQEAQATIHDLQTKLGHADLARQEAMGLAQREREAMAELRAALHQAEQRIAEAELAQSVAERSLAALHDRMAAPVEVETAEPVEPERPRRGRRPRALVAPEPAAVPAKPRKTAAAARGRKPATPAREPKPIRWWVAPRSKKKR